MESSKLLKHCSQFPRSPGVYLMKDDSGCYLYIGKAINLYQRVRSYFNPTSDSRAQIPHLLMKVQSIDWIATENEIEALILEANLIRLHKPPYNIDLKDDKHYPYIKINTKESFPRIVITRRVFKDGSHYFGPYTDAGSMRKLVDFLNRTFRLRTCSSKTFTKHYRRSCIEHSIGRCAGVCTGELSAQQYNDTIKLVLQFLKGEIKEVTSLLQHDMENAAKNLQFERASLLRDQINLIASSRIFQHVDLKIPHAHIDVFGISQTPPFITVVVISFRQGLLLWKHYFTIKSEAWNASFHDLTTLIIQFYARHPDRLPDQIIVPIDQTIDCELLCNWFTMTFQHAVTCIPGKRGYQKYLCTLAYKNASLYTPADPSFQHKIASDMLQSICKLPCYPKTIEAFDISNFGAQNAVAAMVHFSEGKPVKSLYRHYHIKTVEGQNDFAMMTEVVKRRLQRLFRENKPLPDCILIDGGIGQLHYACSASSFLPNPPAFISLAKKEELIISPYVPDPIRLPLNHPALHLLQKIRDEVHRCAITFHRTVRKKSFTTSQLLNCDAIGPKKASILLNKFGSLVRIKRAAWEELAQCLHMSEEKAKKLLMQLQTL